MKKYEYFDGTTTIKFENLNAQNAATISWWHINNELKKIYAEKELRAHGVSWYDFIRYQAARINAYLHYIELKK